MLDTIVFQMGLEVMVDVFSSAIRPYDFNAIACFVFNKEFKFDEFIVRFVLCLNEIYERFS